MKKILAIKGHSTRGKEVIEILEMLGGKNIDYLNGKSSGFYFIGCNNNINLVRQSQTEFITFYLEDFLEKYPYKVGDKVKYKKFHQHADFIYIVKKMIWENNQIKYIICNPCYSEYSFTLTSEDLQLYEDEIYIDYPVDNDSKPGLMVDGEKLIAPKGYTIKTATMDGNSLIVEYIKNKQYPETYAECTQIINKVAKTTNEINIAYKPDLIYDFQKLLICRDAYWKIAGEKMFLSEPWKPDWNNDNQFKYIITCRRNNIIKDTYTAKNCTFVFPTEEMRDAFFENFKDLIEECKEFL